MTLCSTNFCPRRLDRTVTIFFTFWSTGSRDLRGLHSVTSLLSIYGIITNFKFKSTDSIRFHKKVATTNIKLSIAFYANFYNSCPLGKKFQDRIFILYEICVMELNEFYDLMQFLALNLEANISLECGYIRAKLSSSERDSDPCLAG